MLEKWKLLGKILDNKAFSKSDVKVAYCLLDHYNFKTQQIFPTNKRIIKLTGLSKRQVQNSTAKLNDHNLVYKLSIKGKNHYKLTLENYRSNEQTFTINSIATNKPAPPTKPITNININNTIKRLAKRTNPYYKATISNGLSYHQHMENKYIKQMSTRLAPDRYTDWLTQLADKDSKEDALLYARKLCG